MRIGDHKASGDIYFKRASSVCPTQQNISWVDLLVRGRLRQHLAAALNKLITTSAVSSAENNAQFLANTATDQLDIWIKEESLLPVPAKQAISKFSTSS